MPTVISMDGTNLIWMDEVKGLQSTPVNNAIISAVQGAINEAQAASNTAQEALNIAQVADILALQAITAPDVMPSPIYSGTLIFYAPGATSVSVTYTAPMTGRYQPAVFISYISQDPTMYCERTALTNVQYSVMPIGGPGNWTGFTVYFNQPITATFKWAAIACLA